MFKSSDTKCFAQIRVMPKDLNDNETMFGGTILAIIDNLGSVSAQKLIADKIATVGINNVNFINPVKLRQELSVTSFVYQTGSKSIDVFCYGKTRDFQTNETKLAFTAFATYSALTDNALDKVEPDFALAKDVAHNFNLRKSAALNDRNDPYMKELIDDK